MSGYERPTDKGNSKVTISFWAMLWRPTTPDPDPEYGKSAHGYAVPPKRFATQRDLMGWIRENRQEGDEIQMWRRESRDSGSNDFPLNSAEENEPKADPARLHALVSELKGQIGERKAVLDRSRAAHPAGRA